MEHYMKLKEKMFKKLKDREKVYEIKLCDEKRQEIDVEDTIIFVNSENEQEIVRGEVIDLIYFESFEEMVKILPMKKIGFDNYKEKEVQEIFESYYSQEDVFNYGILAIKVEIEN